MYGGECVDDEIRWDISENAYVAFMGDADDMKDAVLNREFCVSVIVELGEPYSHEEVVLTEEEMRKLVSLFNTLLRTADNIRHEVYHHDG